jgi:hypothetical protein
MRLTAKPGCKTKSWPARHTGIYPSTDDSAALSELLL